MVGTIFFCIGTPGKPTLVFIRNQLLQKDSFLIKKHKEQEVPKTFQLRMSIGRLAMSATAGKIALCNTMIALSGTCPTSAAIIDFIGYGAANCSEGSPSPVLSNTTSAERKAQSGSTAASLASGGADATLGNGYDSNNNSADFVAQSSINPQNSASPTEPPSSGGDIIPPSILWVKPLSNTEIEIRFNEPVRLSYIFNFYKLLDG